MQLNVHKLDTFMGRIALDKMFSNDIHVKPQLQNFVTEFYHQLVELNTGWNT